jgi:hypothetical protein
MKKPSRQKWMAKIAQWRERKIVRVNEKKFWMKTDGNSPMERKKKFLCEWKNLLDKNGWLK